MLIKANRQRKAPIFIPARANRGDRQLRRMAAMIENEGQLEAIALQFKPEMREACVARLVPYLKFKPALKSSSV